MFRTVLAFIFLFLIIHFASAAIYPLPKPGNDIIGNVYTVKALSGDTLGKLGLRYGMSLHEMMEANPKISMNRQLRTGQSIIVPAQFILPPYREGIVINMAELRMYYFPSGGKYVMTFPVAMGRDQWRTPTVTTQVVSKEANPVWHVPESIRAYTLENKGELLPEEVPPGPENPLGPYALHLGKAGYLIHGNNVASSIGKFVSSGCIRMNNADITTLYNDVTVGTPVHIVHLPNKIGWFNGRLYLESQLPVELDEAPSDLNATSINEVLEKMQLHKAAQIDWAAVDHVLNQHLGFPQLIGQAASWEQAENNTEVHPPLPIRNSEIFTHNDDAYDFKNQSGSVEDSVDYSQ